MIVCWHRKISSGLKLVGGKHTDCTPQLPKYDQQDNVSYKFVLTGVGAYRLAKFFLCVATNAMLKISTYNQAITTTMIAIKPDSAPFLNQA
jgi:hypothetical protein